MSRRGLAVLSSILLCALAPRVVGQGAWFELEPKHSIPASHYIYQSCAFDEVRGVAVLVGYATAGNVETWEWDGATWTNMNPVHQFPDVSDLVYDSKRRVILAWSARSMGSFYVNELWQWDGKDWSYSVVDSQKGPSIRSRPWLGFDPVRGVLVLFGGYEPVNISRLGDTWEWDGTTWKQVSVKTSPSPRSSESAMVYDHVNKRMILFGGQDQSAHFSDTWSFDGKDWTKLSDSPPPDWNTGCWTFRLYDSGVPNGIRMAWELIRSKPPALLQISDWGGSGWKNQAPASPGAKPAIPGYQSATWDPKRKQLLAVHVYNQNNASVSETWVYAEGQPASFQVVGKGCPGSTTGVPVLGAPQPPVLGKSMELSLSGAPILRPTMLVLADLGADVDLGFLGAPGCRAYAQPQFFFGLVTDFRGQWAINPNFALPRSAALFNAELHAQAWIFDDKANALGLFGSNGGKLTLGF